MAADVTSNEPVPGYRASIKDGYAVCASDGPGEYTVAFEAHAGTPPLPLWPGAIAYISTGGPVPIGADAVVQIEDTHIVSEEHKKVKILRQARPGEDIRDIGSDLPAGRVVLAAGQHIGAAEVGILATVGATTVSVHRKPHVAVLSTGDEVMDPGVGELSPGKIRDANRAMLLAAAAGAGCPPSQVTDLGIAADSKEQVAEALDKAVAGGADVLLTTGGVSMGDKDYIKPLLAERGTIFFGKVRMKPGKPLTFAKIERGGGRPPLLVFGLPGNPASSLVTFHLIVVPCLRKLEGWKDPYLRRIHVKTAFEIVMDPQRPEYHRAVVKWEKKDTDKDTQEGEFVAYSTGGQISSRIMSLKSANVLVEVPAVKGRLAAGTRMTALIVGDLGASMEWNPDIEELKIQAP